MDGQSDKILEVPHLSQILDVSDKHWQRRSCAIVCLAMILQHHLGTTKSFEPDNLIKEGLAVNAYNQEYGWKHSHLALMARNYGLHGYNQEFETLSKDFEEKFVEDGLREITNSIKAGNPVIVSVEPFFSTNKTTHLILLTGVKNDGDELLGFYYRDPMSAKRGGKEHDFVGVDRFLEFWRKLVIFISKEV